MNIFCYGDSWVEGVGSEFEPGSGEICDKLRYGNQWEHMRNRYSWPGQLQTKIIKINNYTKIIREGYSGFSNYDIYKRIINHISTEKIKSGDIAIISLSSILREPLSFLYTKSDYKDDHHGFMNYSNSTMIHDNEHNINNLHWIKSLDDKFKNLTESVYQDYLVNRFNYSFLYEITMNYICNLQIYFEKLGIDYLFVNAFEYNVSKESPFYDQINFQNWILPNYTLQEYLLDKAKEMDKSLPYSVWENDFKNVDKCLDGPHPNKIGYEIISDLIYDELIKRNLINNETRLI